MYRHGDICLVPIEAPDAGGTAEPRDQHGRLVLARGETTDHVHVVRSKRAALLRLPDGRAVLRARDLTRLLDEPTSPGGGTPGRTPHDPISLPPGWYEVRRQREYTPAAIVPVGD